MMWFLAGYLIFFVLISTIVWRVFRYFERNKDSLYSEEISKMKDDLDKLRKQGGFITENGETNVSINNIALQ